MRYYLFCFLISTMCLLQSCQIELADKDKIEMAKKRQAAKQKERKEEKLRKKKEEKNKKAQGIENQIEKVTTQREPTPAFDQLTASRKQTAGAINQINGEYPMMTKTAIKITGDVIKIKGTAIDRPLAKAPSGAFIKIGPKVYPVDNWQAREKFAEKAKNPEYVMTSFSVEIPASDLTPGTKSLSLLVVSSDRENYYTINEKVKIII